MLDVATFVCDRRCGECCKLMTVVLSSEDISRIEGAGHSQDSFVKISGDVREGRRILKHKRDGGCVFLERDAEGLFSCSIRSSRPSVCRKYPFFGDPVTDCRPKTFSDEIKSH